ncbi:hypothetical protein SAY86_014438 [Trapa natans]|uniref:Uncharacterized protein n=1 Tax=Trapa natans TaxID=22666 RepID=A0AAN7KN77_TRANT|nr:hypothetical protein SAY86_014438 [Trapa natans]
MEIQSTMPGRRRLLSGGTRWHATLLTVALLAALQASGIGSSRLIGKGEVLPDPVDQTVVRKLRPSEQELQAGDGGSGFKNLFKSQLPRGPVPPSGSSPCHNYDKLFNFTTTNDYISCP